MLFPFGNTILQYFKVKRDFSTKNEKVIFAPKQLLREPFKVALKEIGKEKIILKFLFYRFRFFRLETFSYGDRC